MFRFESLQTMEGASNLAILGMISCFIYIAVFILEIRVSDLAKKLSKGSIRFTGKMIKRQEDKFSREYEIGLVSDKKFKYKTYKFFDEMTIDLGLKLQGVSPYELLFLIILASLIGSMAFGIIVFGSVLLGVLAFPIMTLGAICGCYTKANLARDARIEAVYEAENIISNNIKGGVRQAVEASFDALPKEVKNEFRDFLNNIDDMMYISVALLDLNNKLGTVADDFIQKCIKFELEEEHGTAGIFQDVVEINNMKSQLRLKMKKSFEEVVTEFIIASCMIVVFLLGVMMIYPFVREFYLTNTIGQIILLIDVLIFILEFVFITYLRAQEF